MGESSKITWTHHTLNPWWGCDRVSAGCKHCYAETFAKRVGHGKRLPTIWGRAEPRRFFGEDHWKEPLRWDEAARAAGERRRVFSASHADVFEIHAVPEINARMVAERARLFDIIERCTSLDFLLLTKRIENAVKLSPWGESPWPKNVWLGTTVEDMECAGKRLLWLLEAPAAVRFVSCEPLLEEVDLENIEFDCLKRDPHPYDPIIRLDALRGHVKGPDEMLDAGVDWVIVGGESGPKRRPFELAWLEKIVAQCKAAGVPVFTKQDGGPFPDRQGRIPAELWLQEYPASPASTPRGAA